MFNHLVLSSLYFRQEIVFISTETKLHSFVKNLSIASGPINHTLRRLAVKIFTINIVNTIVKASFRMGGEESLGSRNFQAKHLDSITTKLLICRQFKLTHRIKGYVFSRYCKYSYLRVNWNYVILVTVEDCIQLTLYWCS